MLTKIDVSIGFWMKYVFRCLYGMKPAVARKLLRNGIAAKWDTEKAKLAGEESLCCLGTYTGDNSSSRGTVRTELLIIESRLKLKTWNMKVFSSEFNMFVRIFTLVIQWKTQHNFSKSITIPTINPHIRD